jgi:hypothetical protein
MALITGTVVGKNKEPQIGAKVFVSNYLGKLSPKKIGTVTDENGKFKLDITNKDDQYLTASTFEGKTTSRIKPEITNYIFDISLGDERVQQLQEIVITAKKQPEKKRNYWWLILLGGALVIGITNRIVKNK